MLQQRFDLGSENYLTLGDTIVQRLFTHPVAGEKQGIVSAIPEGEGEHAVERVQATRAALFIEMHDHFRVRMGAKPVAFVFKLLSQLLVVVNLTVEADPDGFVFVGHRLLAGGGKVDDAESLVAEQADGGGGVGGDGREPAPFGVLSPVQFCRAG